MTDRAATRALIERPMPVAAGARLEAARGTLRALLEERRRLERLGFETPLAHCESQIRFWEFVSRLLSLPADPAGPRGFGTEELPWRVARP